MTLFSPKKTEATGEAHLTFFRYRLKCKHDRMENTTLPPSSYTLGWT